LSPIQGVRRVRNLTDQIFNTPGGPARPGRQAADLTAGFASRSGGPILAHMLRKHPGERSNAMIAATALAVVGLVVVAFLNRIP
jgi:alcohol dehydrogenase class IV